ncbi:MAG: SDR family NAD(P)-dependent oxidoreductase [Candidatus Pacearchaeota archaeon]|jgi:3-oxoacyl-[acyl-carrier protein] reductase
MDIKNKVVLITGASQGIGKSTAITLSKQGANVIINFNSDDNSANEVLEECNKHSQKNMIIKANITNEKEVKEMFDKITKEYNKLDILINNAGIFDESDNPTNLKAFENVFNVNFLAQIRITKYALEIMKTGKIINVSSVHGKIGHGRPNAIAYSAIKAAFDSYTKNLAKYLAPKIIVNAIAPGKTLTPMWGELKEKDERELASTQLINRFILPEEIAEGISFLIKNDAICGEILVIDGGMSLKTLD